jgi:hypothetical protein
LVQYYYGRKTCNTLKNIRIIFECTKVSGDATHISTSLQQEESFSEMDKFKERMDVSNPKDAAFILFVHIANNLDLPIQSMALEIEMEIKLSEEKKGSLFLNPTIHNLINSGENLQRILCDLPYSSNTLIKIRNFRYQIGMNFFDSYTSNTPYLIDTDELGPPLFGYKDQNEFETAFLLKNYLTNGFPARGWLLKFLFKLLDDIDTPNFEIEGKAIPSNSRSNFQAFIQIDIISKIMMYIEDFVILLEGIRTNEGNYYELLGETEESKKKYNVGKILKHLFDNLHTISSDELRKGLSYINPDHVNLDLADRSILDRWINANTYGFRSVIGLVDKFGKTHHPVYRLYKHAGFPFYPGYTSPEPYPYTSTIFDWYSMVFRGENPLAKSIPIPYSSQVIISYKRLISVLTTLIEHVVRNKIECINRRVQGIIPARELFTPDVLETDEYNLILNMIVEFRNKNPTRAYEIFWKFPIRAERDEVEWHLPTKRIEILLETSECLL